MTNVEVRANSNEQNTSVVRRFTQRVRNSGLLKIARAGRYSTRERSQFIKKKDALKLIERREEIEKLKKLGKIPDSR